MTAPRVSLLPSPGLPASAVLCTWLEAVRTGRAGPDDLEDTVRGDDPRPPGAGLPGAIELRELPKTLREAPSLALPAPGDPVGLGGPPDFNFAAIEAGEAV